MSFKDILWDKIPQREITNRERRRADRAWESDV